MTLCFYNKYFYLLSFAFYLLPCKAQRNIDSSAIVWQISAAYGYHFPGGDLVNRFGQNSAIGGRFMIKTKQQWLLALEGDYLFGNEVKEDNMLDNILTKDGFLIGADGIPVAPVFSQSGMLFTIKAGRLFPLFGYNRNSGIIITAGAGLLEHKIRIKADAPQLEGDYRNGYDRLTNGFVLSQFVGYQFMSNNRIFNFYVGFELNIASTRNRRNINFDTMEKDNTQRTDILNGFKAGWVFPIYKKVPDDYYYH